jgi:hypothetical protein
MAKLTPTELKVLAKEAENRINIAVDSKNNTIRNSSEYLNFEDEFNNSMLGLKCINLISLAKEIANEFEILGFKKSYDSFDDKTQQQIERAVGFLKNQSFVMVSTDHLIPEYLRSHYYYNNVSLYDLFLHQLSLKQLTSDADLSKLLDELVKEFIDKL